MKFNDKTNIFNCAPKELSQDAYLMWLASLWNDSDNEVSSFSKEYLNWLFGYKIEIKELKILSQFKKIDVIIYITDKKDKKHILVIEDKTTTKEHDNQLLIYKEELNKYMKKYKIEAQVRYVYYKPFLLDEYKKDNEKDKEKENEKEKVNNAKFEIYDLGKIYDFYEKNCKNIKNKLITDYHNRIQLLHNLLIEGKNFDLCELKYDLRKNFLLRFTNEDGLFFYVTNNGDKVIFQILKKYNGEVNFRYGPSIHIENYEDENFTKKTKIYVHFYTTIDDEERYKGKSDPRLNKSKYIDKINKFCKETMGLKLKNNKQSYATELKKNDAKSLFEVKNIITKYIELMKKNNL